MTINVATVKLLEDKLSDLVHYRLPEFETQKEILLDWILSLMKEQYRLAPEKLLRNGKNNEKLHQTR